MLRMDTCQGHSGVQPVPISSTLHTGPAASGCMALDLPTGSRMEKHRGMGMVDSFQYGRMLAPRPSALAEGRKDLFPAAWLWVLSMGTPGQNLGAYFPLLDALAFAVKHTVVGKLWFPPMGNPSGVLPFLFP